MSELRLQPAQKTDRLSLTPVPVEEAGLVFGFDVGHW